jgi:1,4-dihydroxy-2-naphthoate octaprenyltransferase
MLTDLAAGKHTLAVRLGRKGSMIGLVVFFALIYASIMMLVLLGFLSWIAGLCLLSIPLFLKMIFLLKRTGNWVLLDQYGKYVRMLYFINGMVIIAGLF